MNRTKLDLQVKRVERLLADAYRRRGIALPRDFHYTPAAQLKPHEQFCAWGRRALLNRNFKAAVAASAITLVPTKLKSGDSTDGAVFFRTRPKEKSLGPGRVIARACGQVFAFENYVPLRGR